MKEKDTVEVNVTIPTVSVVVKSGSSREVMEAAAQKAVIAELERNFPISNYVMVNEEALKHEDMHIGMIVESLKTPGLIGIVLRIKKENVDIVTSENRFFTYRASSLKLSSAPFEEVGIFEDNRNSLKFTTSHSTGLSGYLNYKGSIIPVIISGNRGGKYQLRAIGNLSSNVYYSLTKEHMKKYFDGNRKGITNDCEDEPLEF